MHASTLKINLGYITCYNLTEIKNIRLHKGVYNSPDILRQYIQNISGVCKDMCVIPDVRL